MADHLGYRKKFGALGPSTNTIVQPDFDDLRPVGVTNHYSRIIIPNNPVTDDAGFLALVASINATTLDAVDVLKSCEMDYLVMGMSAVTFFDGAKGADAFVKQVEDMSGLKISVGSHACTAAMNARS